MGLVKNTLIFGAGYVTGAAAGRGRYEQIKRKAGELLHRPEVQQAVDRAKGTALRKVPGATDATGPTGADHEGGAAPDTRPSARTWRRTRTAALTQDVPTAGAAVDPVRPPADI
jgi:hypothetical protein